MINARLLEDREPLCPRVQGSERSIYQADECDAVSPENVGDLGIASLGWRSEREHRLGTGDFGFVANAVIEQLPDSVAHTIPCAR